MYCLTYSYTALNKATSEYEKSLGSKKISDKMQYRLGWNVDDLSRLNEEARKMSVEVSSLLDKVRNTSFDLTTANVPRKVSDVRSALLTFVTALSKHTRTAASHIFIFMISSDKRDKKPYAIPIQCVSYRGMKEATLRRLTDQIVHEMHQRQMKVAGKS